MLAEEQLQVLKPLELVRVRQFSVSSDCDLVKFSVGKAEESYSYERALDLSQDLRLHCCQAINTISGHHRVHLEVGDINRFAEIKALLDSITYGPGYQYSNRNPEYRSHVTHDGEQVYVRIGNVKLGLEWEDALKLSTWFQAAGKKAKAWAGNNSSRIRCIGLATNATPDKGPRVF